MQKQIGLIFTVGFFGLLTAANAQTAPSATTGATFDGTYRLVSSTNVNDMYTSYNGHSAMCPHRKPGLLHIVGGRAHYTTPTGYRLGGTVGPKGEVKLRSGKGGGFLP